MVIDEQRSMAAAAVGASAAGPARALGVVLSDGHVHPVVAALLSFHDLHAEAVSLLHALGLVSAVAVAAGRHG